ncbi:MAG: hypothetical protein ACI840_002622, partial [Ulvibacter sp.]
LPLPRGKASSHFSAGLVYHINEEGSKDLLAILSVIGLKKEFVLVGWIPSLLMDESNTTQKKSVILILVS